MRVPILELEVRGRMTFPGQEDTRANGHKESFGGDGYVYHPHCGDGFMGICICPNSLPCPTHYMQFIVYQLYLSTAVFLFFLFLRKEQS